MHLIYNGVYLAGLKLNMWSRDPVLDPNDMDWLYDRHTIDIICLFNPNRTSAAPAAPVNDDFAYSQEPGHTPGVTDAAIREVLNTPRRTLEVYSGSDLILRSPNLNYNAVAAGTVVRSDAANGPHVRKCSILSANGDGTFVVHFVVETCIRECPDDSFITTAAKSIAQRRHLLSNRYATSHDVDERHRTVITYEGVSIFRTDILELQKRYADDYRSGLIPPVPKGFRRMAIKVRAVPSRNALAWTVVDREEFVYLGDPKKGTNPWGVVDFQAKYTVANVSGKEGVPTGQILLNCQCSAVGNNTSSLWNLTQFAIAVCLSKCKQGLPGTTNVPVNCTITQQLHERMVEVNWTTMLYPGKNADGSPITKLLPSNMSSLMNSDTIDVLLEKNGGVYNPPNDNNTRGTYPYRIIANDMAVDAACKTIAPAAAQAGFYVDKNNNPVTLPTVDGGGGTGGAGVRSAAITTTTTRTSGIVDGTFNGVLVRSGVIADFPFGSSNERPRQHWYNVYTAFVDWHSVQGKEIMPLATGTTVTPGQKRASVIDTHAPYQVKTILWEAVRVGRWPEIPDPYTQASRSDYRDEILLDNKVTYAAPVLAQDGVNYVYAARGVYTYAYERTFRTEGVDGFDVAILPWIAGKTPKTDPHQVVSHILEGTVQSSRDDTPTADFTKPWPRKPEDWLAGGITASGRS